MNANVLLPFIALLVSFTCGWSARAILEGLRLRALQLNSCNKQDCPLRRRVEISPSR